MNQAMSQQIAVVSVLLVEDNPGDAFLIQEYLDDDHHCNYDIDHVLQLSEAFSALDERAYDIILLDLSLPDSSGIDTVTRLEASPNLHSPVIVLTGMQNEQVAMQAIQENAQDYMVKSGLDEGALYRAIRYAIERYGLHQDMQQIIQINPTGMVVVSCDGQQMLFSNRAAENTLSRTPSGHVIDLLDIPKQLNKPEDLTVAPDFYLRIRCFEIKWQGKPAFLVKLIDTTQERKLQEKVNHDQRLESLGVLAGGIAHDFNNLLTAIMGNAALARKQPQLSFEVSKSLERIEGCSERAADICRQMLAYSGKGTFVIESVKLTDAVSEMLDLLQVSIAKNIQLNIDLSRDDFLIEADSGQLQQIIMNLVINANEAIGDKQGKISISTGIMHAESSFLSQSWVNETAAEGEYAFLKVSDTGCGIDEVTMKKMFDPFFTTKFAGRGLGMSSILGIVRGHHGCIVVHSEVGKGTMFTVLFQIAKSISQQSAASAESEPWRAKGSVLLVDDESFIREVARSMLESIGFHVFEAADGHEGLELYRLHQDDIAVVLLDMTMPRMGGVETFHELKKINPDVKVVLSSGYSEQDVTRQISDKGLFGFLQKPYRPDKLKAVVKHAMESCV